ncbi:hypothetical protein E2C01_046887 [Portunus trituberculatus]|uniref:Uncharacterized protein n=1 Tax=Portunus trituberculatus TaxID=210409 RepID=A0A5B7G6X1_PORTR|nr:hypothetical protein [Portunus trituberculatus]
MCPSSEEVNLTSIFSLVISGCVCLRVCLCVCVLSMLVVRYVTIVCP